MTDRIDPGYLRAAMDRAGLSAAELSRASGLSASQIGRWLDGRNRPGVEQLRAIAPALGERLLDLLVAVGHLSAEEAGLSGPPPVPEPPARTQKQNLEALRAQIHPDVWPFVERAIWFATRYEPGPNFGG